ARSRRAPGPTCPPSPRRTAVRRCVRLRPGCRRVRSSRSPSSAYVLRAVATVQSAVRRSESGGAGPVVRAPAGTGGRAGCSGRWPAAGRSGPVDRWPYRPAGPVRPPGPAGPSRPVRWVADPVRPVRPSRSDRSCPTATPRARGPTACCRTVCSRLLYRLVRSCRTVVLLACPARHFGKPVARGGLLLGESPVLLGLPLVDLRHAQVVRRIVLLVDVRYAAQVLVALLLLGQPAVLGVAQLQQHGGQDGGDQRTGQDGGLGAVGQRRVAVEGEFTDEQRDGEAD